MALSDETVPDETVSDETVSDETVPDEGLPIVKFSGAVDLRNIEAALDNVKAVFDAGGSLDFDLAEVTDLDLTLVQLVESARQTAAAAGKQVRLTAPAAGMLREALQRGGFLSEPPDARTRFWLGQQVGQQG